MLPTGVSEAGSYLNSSSELPEIFYQKETKYCQKGHKRDFSGKKATHGRSEITDLFEVQRTLVATGID